MATAPKFDSYITSPDACFTVDDISKNNSQWDGTLLKHLHKNYNGKYGDSLLARIFLDFKLRDDLELFFKFILPKPEDYIYLVSTKTIDIFNLLINYYDQIKGQTTDGLVGSLATTFTSNENLVNYYFIVREIIPDINKIDVDFLKALRELVICCRVLITGGNEVSGIPYTITDFILNNTLLTTLNKMFQTIYFLCDYLNYKTSDFNFNNFINKILNASDTTNYAKIISIRDTDAEPLNEALSRGAVGGINKYSYIRFIENYKLHIKVNLDKEFSNLKERYKQLPYSFVLLDMIFEKNSIKNDFIPTPKGGGFTYTDTLLDLLKAGFVDNTMLFLLSFKLDIKKHSDIYGIYGIIPEKISNKVDAFDGDTATGDSATIVTPGLQLLVDSGIQTSQEVSAPTGQTPPEASKLYLLNLNHFILKNLFYEIENNEEIKKIVTFVRRKEDETLKNLQIVQYNLEDVDENTIEPEKFILSEQVNNHENKSNPPKKKESRMEHVRRKFSNFGKKLKNRKTYAFLNPVYAFTKIMTTLIIKIIIPIIKDKISNFNDEFNNLQKKEADLFEIIDSFFNKSKDLVNNFLSQPDIAQKTLADIAIDSQNQALISLVEFLDEYSFFYLVSPIESKLLNQVIDLCEFPKFLTNTQSKTIEDWDNKEDKISTLLNKEIKNKIESIKTKERTGDGNIISFENYFFLELTELREIVNEYGVSLEEKLKKRKTGKIKKILKMIAFHSSGEMTEEEKKQIVDLLKQIENIKVSPPTLPLFTEKFNTIREKIENSLEIPSLVEYYLSGCRAKNTVVDTVKGAVSSVCQLFRPNKVGGTRKRLHNKSKNSRRIRTNKKKYKKIKSKRLGKNNRNRRTRKSRTTS